jgi:hypothetical protein
MSIGSDLFRHYLEWRREGWSNQCDSVLDLGAQELVCFSSQNL